MTHVDHEGLSTTKPVDRKGTYTGKIVHDTERFNHVHMSIRKDGTVQGIVVDGDEAYHIDPAAHHFDEPQDFVRPGHPASLALFRSVSASASVLCPLSSVSLFSLLSSSPLPPPSIFSKFTLTAFTCLPYPLRLLSFAATLRAFCPRALFFSYLPRRGCVISAGWPLTHFDFDPFSLFTPPPLPLSPNRSQHNV